MKNNVERGCHLMSSQIFPDDHSLPDKEKNDKDDVKSDKENINKALTKATTWTKMNESADDANKPLTQIQKQFIQNYIDRGFNIGQASLDLFPNKCKATAKAKGWEIYRLPHVKKEIDKLVMQHMHDKGLNKDACLTKWLDMINADITDYIQWDIVDGKVVVNILPSSQVDGTVVKTVKVNKNGQLELEMYDKQTALKQLGEMMGWYPGRTNNLEISGKGGAPIQVEAVRSRILDRLARSGAAERPVDTIEAEATRITEDE